MSARRVPLARLARPAARFALAVALACLVGAGLLLATGQSPAQAAVGIFQGAFGSSITTLASLALSTPLILSALSFIFAFRAGVFNAGGQGQFEMGAFAAAWVGFASPFAHLSPWIHVPLVVLGGAVGGALWALPPILWKVAAGMNEILTTLMMSYVASLLNQYLVEDVYRATGVQPGANTQTFPLAAGARFPPLFPQSQVTFMLPLAIAAAVFIAWFYARTVTGYELGMVGTGREVAEGAGLNVRRLMVVAMLGSGALAGMAGAAVTGGVFFADITPFSSNVGFNGILAALLAGNVPLLAPVTGLFFGALQNGGLGLQIFTPISRYIADVLTAGLVMFVSARSLPGEGWRRRPRLPGRSRSHA